MSYCFIMFLYPLQGFWSRYFPIYAHLRTELNSKTVGDVKLVSIDFGVDLASSQNYLANRKFGDGPLLAIGCYCIQLATLVYGERPERVVSSGILTEEGM